MIDRLAYGVEEAAEALCVCKNTVWKHIAEKELATFKLGRRTLIEAGSLREFIRRRVDHERAA